MSRRCPCAVSCWQTYLFTALKEEDIWVNPIGDGTPNEWDPMEDQRRLVWILVEQLEQNVDDDGKDEERGKSCHNDNGRGLFADSITYEGGNRCKETHGVPLRTATQGLSA